jgi:hypothetical protein
LTFFTVLSVKPSFWKTHEDGATRLFRPRVFFQEARQPRLLYIVIYYNSRESAIFRESASKVREGIYDKSELAFQSPRLWHWAEREKLLLMASLAYAFLLSLLEPFYDPLRCWLLRSYCHRTGWHCRWAKAPLYRLRSALSRLWQEHPPDFAALGRPATRRQVISITLN